MWSPLASHTFDFRVLLTLKWLSKKASLLRLIWSCRWCFICMAVKSILRWSFSRTACVWCWQWGAITAHSDLSFILAFFLEKTLACCVPQIYSFLASFESCWNLTAPKSNWKIERFGLWGERDTTAGVKL